MTVAFRGEKSVPIAACAANPRPVSEGLSPSLYFRQITTEQVRLRPSIESKLGFYPLTSDTLSVSTSTAAEVGLRDQALPLLRNLLFFPPFVSFHRTCSLVGLPL